MVFTVVTFIVQHGRKVQYSVGLCSANNLCLCGQHFPGNLFFNTYIIYSVLIMVVMDNSFTVIIYN